jgi:predicted regulator of Ras-like GTPase activity (Roadblock/LC7/MglB family)
MTQKTNAMGQLNWLLDDLVERVPGVRDAAVLSADGLLVGGSAGLDQAAAEHLAAVASGLQSLARGASRHFGGGPVRQTIIEMESAFLFVTAAGSGSSLAIIAAADADIGQVAFEMNLLVRRVGQSLSTSPRNQPPPPGPSRGPVVPGSAGPARGPVGQPPVDPRRGGGMPGPGRLGPGITGTGPGPGFPTGPTRSPGREP